MAGFARADGRKGIRNVVAVACMVESVHFVAREISATFRDQAVHLIGFPGCCPNAYADKMIRQLVTHPNEDAVLLMSLGCESFDTRGLDEPAAASGRSVHRLTIQERGGTRKTLAEGIEWVQWAQGQLTDQPRVPITWHDLVVATACGGFDGTSGITASPAVGRAFDTLTARGAACIFKETGELVGCEFHFQRRAGTPALGDETVRSLAKAVRYCKTLGHGSFASGNADGGLSTPEKNRSTLTP